MMTTPHRGKKGPHPVIAGAARELLGKSDNKLSGVLSTVMSCSPGQSRISTELPETGTFRRLTSIRDELLATGIEPCVRSAKKPKPYVYDDDGYQRYD